MFGGNIPPSGHGFASGNYDPGVPGVLGPTGIVGASMGGPGKQIAALNLCAVPTVAGTKHIRCASAAAE